MRGQHRAIVAISLTRRAPESKLRTMSSDVPRPSSSSLRLAILAASFTVFALGCDGNGSATDAATDAAEPTDAADPGDADPADGGLDASDASAVEPCAANTYVSANACVACPAGTDNEAGDDPSAADTVCDAVLCETDFHVVGNACVACAAGTSREAGDDATGADTTCTAIVCEENFHVVGNACVACAPGSTRAAGDDATGADTACTATVCAANFHVVDHACVACPSGVRPAGDDATGADTSCCGPAWGVGASVGVAAGEFQDAFVATGSAASLSTTSWTALSVFDTGGSRTPGAAYWVRTTTGVSPGAYWGSMAAIDSPSMANGVALFDSDFLDNAGTQGDFGAGTSPTVHRGELVSPPIDLSAFDGATLSARLYTWYRNFQIDELSVSVSVDGGATWGTPANLRNAIASLTKGYATVSLGSYPASTDLSNVRMRVVFSGDYYFAMVDDVTLYACE